MNIMINDVRVLAEEKLNMMPRIYFLLSNESIVDHLQNRRSRPYRQFRKFLPEVIRMAGLEGQIDADNDGIAWSQNAGCSCGCSPGFIVHRLFPKSFSIYVDAKVTEKEEQKA